MSRRAVMKLSAASSLRSVYGTSKRGQGLSLNTIIIGLIVLVVLVVLIAIFTGFSERVVKDVTSCESKGGKCVSGTDCGSDVFGRTISELDADCEGASVCCPKVITETQSIPSDNPLPPASGQPCNLGITPPLRCPPDEVCKLNICSRP